MTFDTREERDRHVLLQHPKPALPTAGESREWRVRVGPGKGKVMAEFLKNATPEAVLRLNELSGYGQQPSEPFVCG
jgi:hypothetical protein